MAPWKFWVKFAGKSPRLGSFRSAVTKATLFASGLVLSFGSTGRLTIAQAPPSASPASSSPAVAFDASLDPWVKKLGDSHFRQRELASQTLRKAGAPALACLRKSVNDPDPEIRQRVLELVSEIEASIQMEPKRVTLRETNKSAKDVLAALAKTSGYPIDLWNDPGGPISIACVDKPFWEVIDQISEKSGLTLQQNYGDDRVRLSQTGVAPRYVDYSGPFRISAQSIQQHKVVDLAAGREARRSETLSLQLVVFSEPRMPILGLGEAKLVSAFDSEGNSLIPPSPAATGEGGFRGRSVSRYGNGYRMLSMQSSVALRRQNDRAKEAAIIKGTVLATLLAQQDRIVLSENIMAEKGKKLEASNMTFLVEQVGKPPNGGLELKLTISDKSKDPSDMTWMNSLMQRIEVKDKSGAKLVPNGTNWHQSGQNFVQISFTFSPPNGKVEKDPKYELIFQNWKTVDQLVSFELRNIPLP